MITPRSMLMTISALQNRIASEATQHSEAVQALVSERDALKQECEILQLMFEETHYELWELRQAVFERREAHAQLLRLYREREIARAWRAEREGPLQ